MPRFRPQLRDSLPGLTREQLYHEITAGITVGIVALPLAIAFAIASNVAPERGLTTAIVAGGLIALLGGSRVQIGGPTGAFVVLVAGIVEHHGIEGLLLATLLAGVILIAGGLLKAGRLIRYIPLPVTIGFTSGIALVIAAGQVFDALGLSPGRVPAAFLPKLPLLLSGLGGLQWQAVLLTLITLLMITRWPRQWSRIPPTFVALLLTTAAVSLLNLPVETIGSRFGELPASLPRPHFPEVTLEQLSQLIGPAFTIALLGAIESLLSAVVADSMTGQRHRANTELVAQGIANIASPLFGGIPATGAIARTATNIRSGATTPIAGIVHSLTLLLILLVAAPLAGRIPMATLAGILLVVSWKMADIKSFLRLARGPRHGAAVLLTTFSFTVLADLTVGISVGVALAAALFVQQMTASSAIQVNSLDDDDNHKARRPVPPGVRLLEIDGPLFFGTAERLRDELDLVAKPARLLLIDLDRTVGLDVTSSQILADFTRRSLLKHSRVIFITENAETAMGLKHEGLEHALSIERALQRAADLVAAASPDPNSAQGMGNNPSTER